MNTRDTSFLQLPLCRKLSRDGQSGIPEPLQYLACSILKSATRKIVSECVGDRCVELYVGEGFSGIVLDHRSRLLECSAFMAVTGLDGPGRAAGPHSIRLLHHQGPRRPIRQHVQLRIVQGRCGRGLALPTPKGHPIRITRNDGSACQLHLASVSGGISSLPGGPEYSFRHK